MNNMKPIHLTISRHNTKLTIDLILNFESPVKSVKEHTDLIKMQWRDIQDSTNRSSHTILFITCSILYSTWAAKHLLLDHLGEFIHNFIVETVGTKILSNYTEKYRTRHCNPSQLKINSGIKKERCQITRIAIFIF